MGTQFRTMLAPVGPSTGDGRRFAPGGIHLADVPFPLEWARSREGGHDGAVTVGVIQQAAILTVAEAVTAGFITADTAHTMDPTMTAVWAQGEMFDNANREEMPRLAEDVAEAMHLMSVGTLGPSVDLDSFEGSPVMAGTDQPVTMGMIEEYQAKHGEDPKVELLITSVRIRAATLVSIPAFAETSRPLELIVPEQEPMADGGEGSNIAALVASVATAVRPDMAAFTLPTLDKPTPITWDWDTGRVFGHIATWQTCHVGYPDVCVTAPRDGSGGYAAFNRFPVDTADGDIVWAGRITVGGRHADLSLAASAAMATYDMKTVAAHVRAYEDDHGIVVAGVIELAVDSPERAVLERRKVSGDWRETPNGLSLVEVLALSPGPRAHAEPGFPVTFSRAGRQVALTAALGPDPDAGTLVAVRPVVDVDALVAAMERRQQERAMAAQARAGLAAAIRGAADMERATLAAMVG